MRPPFNEDGVSDMHNYAQFMHNLCIFHFFTFLYKSEIHQAEILHELLSDDALLHMQDGVSFMLKGVGGG